MRCPATKQEMPLKKPWIPISYLCICIMAVAIALGAQGCAGPSSDSHWADAKYERHRYDAFNHRDNIDHYKLDR